MTRYVTPWEGYPRTRARVDAHGRRMFTIKPRALTPLRAQLADGLAQLLALGTTVAGYAYLIRMPDAPPDWVWLVPLAFAPVTLPPLRLTFKQFLKRSFRIDVTHDAVKLRTWWGGWKSFQRTLPHKVSVLEHDQAQLERQFEDLKRVRAQQRGEPAKFPKQYYGHSFHIALDYVGQRYDLLTVFDQKHASAIAARIRACGQLLDGDAGHGDGVADDPSRHWGGDGGDSGDIGGD